ncbi:MAG: META domain-containing protein [Flavobacteriales bacterium]
MKALLTASFLSLLFATACNSGSDAKSSEPQQQSAVQKDEPAITGTHWKLVTLEGQPEKKAENQEQDRYFTLDTADKTVSGFAGCNSILGSYALEDGMRIRFSNMGLTMRACPDVAVDEQAFMEVFAQADNYTITNGTLSLNVGRRAPLAVFEVAK